MSNMENKYTPIGSFQCNGGLVLSDPCYEQDEKHLPLMGFIMNCAEGTWHAEVSYSPEGRVAELFVYSDDLEEEPIGTYTIDDLYVDSGQLGVFDFGAYPDSEEGETVGKYSDEESFYKRICNLTDSGQAANMFGNEGVVAMSGWGDGIYEAYVTRDTDGFARSVMVVFIDEEDDSEEDESDLN